MSAARNLALQPNSWPLLATAGDNPMRLRSETAFADLCAASPIPASSGKTHRHRLNPAGDRAANRALHMIAFVRMRWCPQPEPTSSDEPKKDYPKRTSSAA
jgi:transposase